MMETKEIAREAAREAVREMMLTLGVDVSSPDGVQRAQRNWAFLDDLRTGTAALRRKSLLTIFGAVLTAAIAYMAIGFRGH